jgi:hypothetical protein
MTDGISAPNSFANGSGRLVELVWLVGRNAVQAGWTAGSRVLPDFSLRLY